MSERVEREKARKEMGDAMGGGDNLESLGAIASLEVEGETNEEENRGTKEGEKSGGEDLGKDPGAGAHEGIQAEGGAGGGAKEDATCGEPARRIPPDEKKDPEEKDDDMGGEGGEEDEVEALPPMEAQRYRGKFYGPFSYMNESKGKITLHLQCKYCTATYHPVKISAFTLNTHLDKCKGYNQKPPVEVPCIIQVPDGIVPTAAVGVPAPEEVEQAPEKDTKKQATAGMPAQDVEPEMAPELHLMSEEYRREFEECLRLEEVKKRMQQHLADMKELKRLAGLTATAQGHQLDASFRQPASKEGGEDSDEDTPTSGPSRPKPPKE